MLVRLLRGHLRPYVGALLAIVGLTTVGTMATLYLPSLNANVIDHGVARGDTHTILRLGAWMLAVSLVQITCSIGSAYLGARTAMAFGRDLRAAVFHRVLGFSGREVMSFGAPSLITRGTNDVQQVQMLVQLGSTLMVAAPIMCVGGVVMALHEDVGLSWLMGVSVPVVVAAIGFIISRMVPKFRAMQTLIDRVNRVLREQLAGIRVVRAFVREPVEIRRFSGANRELTDTALSAARWMVLIAPTVTWILNVSGAAVLWFGAGRILGGKMEIGALTAFLSYLTQILLSVMMATFMSLLIPRAAVCADRIGEVLRTESSLTAPAQPVRTLPHHRGITFRDVEVRHPGAAAPVLRGISFEARAGQTTAIIGSTGSGKSTLVSLVPRLFDVSAGAVLIDGVDVRALDPELLARLIGWVPQRPYLFSGTVASNLRYGNPDAEDSVLRDALTVAQALDFVEAMPKRLEEPVSQGGTNVSGGQRQRLAIARALVKRPAIYLFDDAFSALDLATDARLRAALRPRTADATVLIVAQRVSTILDADRIVVLDKGAIVGIGTHAELLQTCATYREIVESQLTAEAA